MERRIFSLYSKLSHFKRTEAEVKYIDLSKRIPLSGVTLFDVVVRVSYQYMSLFQESNQIRKLGIVEDGFLISRKDSKTTFDFYPFEEISGWNQVSTGIQIRISDPDKVIWLGQIKLKFA